MLTGLPGGPFAVAAAFQSSEPLRNLAGWFFGEQGRKLNPALDKLPADQQAKLADIFGRLMAQQENAKFWVGATKPDEPLLSNTVMIAKVEDAKKYLALFEEFYKLQAEFYQVQLAADKDAQPNPALGEIQHIQVDGHEAL